MPLLVTHGGYKLSPTNRADPGLGSNDRRPRIPDIGRGTSAKCPRRISPTVRTTVATNGAYQAELAKEYDHVPTGEIKNTSSNATPGDDQQRSNPFICRKYQHAGGLTG